jgi:hypothetical protein
MIRSDATYDSHIPGPMHENRWHLVSTHTWVSFDGQIVAIVVVDVVRIVPQTTTIMINSAISIIVVRQVVAV